MFSVVTTANLVLGIRDIADRLGLTTRDFERYRQLGLILVVVEAGSGEHEGLTKRTCQLGNRVWQAVVDGNKHIVREETRHLRGKRLQAPHSRKSPPWQSH